ARPARAGGRGLHSKDGCRAARCDLRAVPAARGLMSTRPVQPGIALTLPPGLAARPELGPLAWALGRGDDTARAAYLGTAAHNLRVGRALDEALDGLAAASVRAQPLKGALFVETLYGGDLGARPMADLDILVPPADLERAHAVLVGLGYAPWGLGRVRWSPR